MVAMLHSMTQDQRSELARDGTPEQRLRTAVSAHQNSHSSDAAVRKRRAFNRGGSIMGQITEGRLAAGEKLVHKHLHACIVASHVGNRARDACCLKPLT